MRLDILLAREPFTEIFSATISNFLSHIGLNAEITWQYGHSIGLIRKERKFIVNDKLNIIYPVYMSPKILRPLTREYGFHTILYRRVAQSFYVRYGMHFPLTLFSTKTKILFSPWHDEFSSWCIIPGNHSIRIIDLARDISWVIRKNGFSKQFYDNGIAIRKRYPELPIPALLLNMQSAGYYLEKRVLGLPVNREPQYEKRATTFYAACDALFRIYETTRELRKLDEWLVDRRLRIQMAINRLPSIYSAEIRRKISEISHCLMHNANLHKKDSLIVAATHGDFQPANILIPVEPNDNVVFLIDWEYAGQRFMAYDAFVYALESRFPNNLSIRINNSIKKWSDFSERILWCGYQLESEGDAINAIILFLIDELLLRIEETKIPDLRLPSPGLLTLLYEIKKLRWLH